MLTIQTYGSSAIIVSLEEKIDIAVNEQVHLLDELLTQSRPAGVLYTIPAYHTLTIVFDPELIIIQDLEAKIRSFESQLINNSSKNKQRSIELPVCYDPTLALDISYVMEQQKLSWQEIVNLHTQKAYRVFMLGFIPGFAFMGKINPYLEIARKQEPRLKVPKGSVGLAGLQTGIYPDEVPGGWQIIGRTPIPLFQTKNEDPFLLKAGDDVRFYAIDLDTFNKIEADLEGKTFDWNIIYG